MVSERELPHIYLSDHGQRQSYTSPRKIISPPPPVRNREAHADNLLRSLTRALEQIDIPLVAADYRLERDAPGFYLEFELSSYQADAIDKLENRQGKSPIELLTVRKKTPSGDRISATVFVPEERKEFFTRRLEQYRSENTRADNPKNESLVAFLEDISIANARSLFTGQANTFPGETVETWWEVWLRKDTRHDFLENARLLEIQVKDHYVHFVERDVILALSSPIMLDRLVAETDSIAELRIACDNPSIFMAMDGEEQFQWAEEVARLVDPPEANAPAVCVLDTGTTLRHPLINVALDPRDQHAYEPAWQVEDIGRNGGHGTEMSGLSLYGDLTIAMGSLERLALTHCLESVKILPDVGDNDPRLYGDITGASIARAELQAPERLRAICLAITSDTDRLPGEPSSWSAAIDSLAYEPDNPRFIAISAGNIRQPMRAEDYLVLNDLAAIENPAQAWNALTVGAYTEKINITDQSFRGWYPLGVCGDLSPRSRTSVCFDSKWPIKPDVVLEGGNWAVDPSTEEIDHVDDLTLLTTFRRPEERAFTVTRDTSAATALAARMAAQIMAEHIANRNERLWPETVRALMVHSAEWTEAMLAHLPRNPTQGNWRTLLCRYGYGIPDLTRALRSLSNDVSIVIEKEFSPFWLDGSTVKTQDMIIHDLPWPTLALEEIAHESVEMRVTLSYFIEPNPGMRGWTRKHRYSSHGLRFKVKRESETFDAFAKRINKAVREEEGVVDNAGDDGWIIGERLRDRGSVHSDIWRGTAAELAAKHVVAVFPVSGWWKEKKYLERYDRTVRYSLVISIRALSDVEVDLYTPIQSIVSATVPVEAES